VRPDHLFLGTKADNNADKVAKGRNVSPCGDASGSRLHPESRPRGEANGSSRFSESEVRTIRALHAAGQSQRSIALTFSASQGTISAIVLGRKWRHILPQSTAPA
jgi:hypothetical protein